MLQLTSQILEAFEARIRITAPVRYFGPNSYLVRLILKRNDLKRFHAVPIHIWHRLRPLDLWRLVSLGNRYLLVSKHNASDLKVAQLFLQLLPLLRRLRVHNGRQIYVG